MRFSTLFVIFLFLCAGCAERAGYYNNSYNNSSYTGGRADNSSITLEDRIMDSLLPYDGVEYANITIKRTGNEIVVVATSESTPREDVYKFVYDPERDELVLTGYLLEAIPEEVREKAIAVALTDEEIAGAIYSGSFGEPSVRRILPQTSAKFYTAKQLFSVTWRDFDRGQAVSALIDVEEGRVVQKWSGSAQE